MDTVFPARAVMTNDSPPRVSADVRAMMAFDAAKKSAVVAYLLWLFLGFFGVHRLYAGKILSGLIMLALCLVSMLLSLIVVGYLGFVVLGLWWFIDAFLLAAIIRRHNTLLMHRLTGPLT